MSARLACLLLAASITLAACDRTRGDATTAPAVAQVPTDQTLDAVPLGAPPGEPVSIASRIVNPFAGNAQAVAEGKALFSSMNCVYCHGAQASGLMGPALNGAGWRYGGTPAELYNSVHDGRPQGMPAWGSRLPPDQIWKIVSYLQSLGDASGQPSTTGAQAAEQDAADTAHQNLIAGQKVR